MGGLGICDPTELCDVDFGSSLAGVTVVSAAIDGTTEFDWSEHLASLHAALVSRHERVNSWYEDIGSFLEARQRTIKQAVHGKLNLPLADHLSLGTLSF